MSPWAEPASTAAGQRQLGIEEILKDGEVVILAAKPSMWFVLLVSRAALAVAVLLTAAAYAAEALLPFRLPVPRELVALFALALACLRVVFAAFQWAGRLYVLTNLRVLRVRGVLSSDLFQCPLKAVEDVRPSASLGERLVGAGTLVFSLRTPGGGKGEEAWVHVHRVEEIERVVRDTLRRYK